MASQQKPIVVEVTADITPGETQLKVAPAASASHELLLLVPKEAQHGDRLILTEGEDGEWKCQLHKCQPRTSAEPAGTHQEAQQGSQPYRVAYTQVPEDAEMGTTQLVVDMGALEVPITVPAVARPGDWLKLSKSNSDGKGLKLEVVRKRSATDQDAGVRVAMTVLEVDDQESFAAMREAARRCGASVHPGLYRGVVPKMGISGLLTSEEVTEGEELFRIPARLHLSSVSCKEIFPELFRYATRIEQLSESRRVEASLSLCLAVLMADVVTGTTTCEDRCPEASKRILALWKVYAWSMLGLNFEDHPWWRSLRNAEEFNKAFQPSSEAEYARTMAGDAIAIHGILAGSLSPDLLGPGGFDVGLFLQARLSFLTREFGTPHDSSLVPLLDFCNHQNNPNAHQTWDVNDDSMVVKATRTIKAGEEVTISYGVLPNPVLLRTYGFTLPGEEEPNWAFSSLASLWEEQVCPEVAEKLRSAFTPFAEVQMSSTRITESLARMLDTCEAAGGDGLAILRTWCEARLTALEGCPVLIHALNTLKENRQKDPRSSNWWSALTTEGCSPEEEEDAPLRVRMSEYLCLLAHREALDMLDGRLPEEKMLSGAQEMHQALKEATAAEPDLQQQQQQPRGRPITSFPVLSCPVLPCACSGWWARIS
mmetsp:Transcript_86883/g.190845  ORF Transcript_86883/g.190845 Transcript_86883/m.190845 type:complete len:653 (+) Transcript_86883:229-2187(+)